MAARKKATRRRKSSLAANELEVFLAKRNDGAGAMFGRVLMERDHFAAGADGLVYVYDNGVYVDAAKFVERRIQAVAGAKWTRNQRNETLEWLAGAVPELDSTPDPDVINVRNGLLRWNGEGWKLGPHSPEHRTTMQLPVSYRPRARCPQYGRFIKSSQPDPEVRRFLDEWLGYQMTTQCDQEKALINFGKSGAGKSIYLYVLENLVGSDNASGVSLQEVSSDAFAAADLYGKLANVCADISSEELRATGTFKKLVSGDLLRAQHKYKKAFKFHNVAKLSFSANELPASRDCTTAFFERWAAVTWPRKFRGMLNEDKALKHKIVGSDREMSGVLNRALAGLTRLRRSGSFTSAPALDAAKDEFRRGADSVAAYLIDADPHRWQRTVWYADYKEWCRENGHQSLASGRFYERMRNWQPLYGIEVRATRSKGYQYFRVSKSRGSEG